MKKISLTNEAKNYLVFVWVFFVIAAIFCVGLLINGLWLMDSVNAYITAVELMGGIMRMTALSSIIASFIDLYARG